MTLAIDLSNITKSFGPKQAVRDLSLQVPRGALYGIIGPNGAGKSTSLRILLAILFADSGSVRVLGEDSALKAKDRIGYLPEERGVYRKMKVADFLTHMAVLKGVPRNDCARRVAHWLERVGLPDVAKKRCEELSKGMQQKVQFIAAVIHEPELLVLDEPASGLDPVAARLLRELILEQHARGTTILFSTHAMAQAEQICQHIVMIHEGRKVLDNPLSAIHARHAPRSLRLVPLDPEAPVAGVVGALHGIIAVERQDGQWRIDFDERLSPGAAMQAVAAALPPARLELLRPSLEDVFIGIATQRSTDTEVAA